MNAGLQRKILDALCGTGSKRRLIILSYHRIVDVSDPLLPEEPSADFFTKQLEWVSELMVPMSLPDAAERLGKGDLPARALCITFDDGYRNNFEVAAPILARFGLPATFFIATGALSDGAMWNDLIIESVRKCGGRFDLSSFGLGDHTIASDADRARVANEALMSIKYLPDEERAERSREIYRAFCGDVPPSLMMTAPMVESLSRSGFDVGAHTINHPILSKVDDARAIAEIEGSRDWLASVTGRMPLSFAYPNGRPEVDFTAKHRDMVRDAGFLCAVSTAWGCASPSSDVMSLPRFTPWESTRGGFFMRLAKTYVQSYRPASPGA